MVGSAGVGVTPGPSHWKSGVPFTPIGRVTEQVRVTVSPAMMGEEGEEVREMVVGSVGDNNIMLISVVATTTTKIVYIAHNKQKGCVFSDMGSKYTVAIQY